MSESNWQAEIHRAIEDSERCGWNDALSRAAHSFLKQPTQLLTGQDVAKALYSAMRAPVPDPDEERREIRWRMRDETNEREEVSDGD